MASPISLKMRHLNHFIFSLFLFSSLPALASEETPFIHFYHDNDWSGNDLGYTGGIHAEVGVAKTNGWRYSMVFQSDLYSQRVIPYGDRNNPQYQVFTGWDHAPKNTIGLAPGIQDERIEQNSLGGLKLEYRSRDSIFNGSIEGGITQTESNAAYIPGTSGWQQVLHHLVGAVTYDIISDGIGPRWGVYFKTKGGMEVPVFPNSSISLTLKTDLGGSIDTEGRRTFLDADAGFRLGTLSNHSREGELLQLLSLVETQLSGTHKQLAGIERLNFNWEESTLFVGVTYLFTNTGYSDNYETTYIDQDILYRIGFTFYL